MATIHVLLVDDEEDFLAVAKSRLETRGATVFATKSGSNALEMMETCRIDVAVLDLRMPEMSGIDLLREIKIRHPLVEVILLTGQASGESAIQGMRLGAFDYVTKPCDVSDLMDKVNEAYAKKKAVEDKIRRAKIDRIISHPMAVFDEEEY